MTTILNCKIVRDDINPCGNRDCEYEVYDKEGKIISKGVSSSPSWVEHDAGGYHTKEKFDKLYPDGWEVIFNF